MNPALLLVVALGLIYAAATGRAEAVWKALTDPVSSGVKTKSKAGSGSDAPGSTSNPATK